MIAPIVVPAKGDGVCHGQLSNEDLRSEDPAEAHSDNICGMSTSVET